jgi:hypothetical protein
MSGADTELHPILLFVGSFPKTCNKSRLSGNDNKADTSSSLISCRKG